MATPQTLPADFKDWDKAPATLPADFNQWDQHAGESVTHAVTPAEPSDQGWFDREIPLTDHWNATLSGLQNIARGGKQAIQAAWESGKLPTTKDEWAVFATQGPVGLAAYRAGKSLVDTGKQAAQVPGAIHDINESPDPTNIYLDVAGRTAGEGAGQAITALATEAAPHVVQAVSNKIPTSVKTAPVRLAARSAEAAANQKLVPVRPILNIMTPADTAEAVSFKVPGRDFGLEKPFADPGAPLPDNPGTFPGAPFPTQPAEVAQSSALAGVKTPTAVPAAESGEALATVPQARVANSVASRLEDVEGVPSPQTESASTSPLEVEPEAAAPAPEAAAAIPSAPSAASPVTARDLERQLTESLGGKKLVPGVSLKNQPAAMGTSLPKDFTPVKSSALKGYKYDPATREFESVTQGGQHYIHGDVSPEAAAAFEQADSKGKAWQKIRDNPLVAKVVNGKRVAVVKPRTVVVDPETGKPEFSDVVDGRKKETPAAAKSVTPQASAGGEGDLTSLLEKSLDQVQAPKGGVQTSAAPGDLAQRWGVTSKSIADTDANVRGMNEAQSKAYIDKLVKSYKEGKPVQPVMETRDANNNIISVDGRHRALAAKLAGIERIPVIVRRLAAQ